MMKHLCCILFTGISCDSFSQVFLNGSFESTVSDKDTLNIPSLTYDILMPNSYSFGTLANIDILSTDAFCGPAQDGNWYIALTGGATDQVSLKLSEPLITGRSYLVSFYDRMCPEIALTKYPIQVGVSTKSDNFGELMYTAANPANEWSLRSFSFTAVSPAEFVTVRIKDGNSHGTWTQIDNFTIACTILSPLGNDTILCEGDTFQLRPAIPNSTFVWQDGSTLPAYTVTQPGKYWVSVNTGVCVGADTVTIGYQKCSGELFIPNSFSPNGDGINDLFRIPGFLQDFEMKIYNRWGLPLFSTKSMQDGWDGRVNGTIQPMGTYVYIIQYNEIANKRKLARGTVTLIR